MRSHSRQELSDFGHTLSGRGLVVFPHPSWLAGNDPMRRREFIALSAVPQRVAARGARAAGRADAAHRSTHAWPANDAEARDRITAFAQALQLLGWIDGQNVGSTTAWRMARPTPCENMRPNWLRSHRRSSWRFPAPPLRHCWRPPASSLSCSRVSLTRLRQVMSRALRGQAVTPPGSPFTNIPSQENGWNCSKRSRRA